MNFLKKILILVSLFFGANNLLYADAVYFVDFKYILNKSTAGDNAQEFLQKKLDTGIKALKAKEKKIQDDEKNIIKQKKVISAEEYKKKVVSLRQEVSNLQKQRNDLVNDVAKQRAKAKSELLKNLNPIVKTYMEKNNIRIVLDKKSILLADEKLDITKEIIALLNEKLKSIKLN